MIGSTGDALATLITIKVKDGHFMEWLDLDLPQPLSVNEVNQYGAAYWNDKNESSPYELTYAITGFFQTSKNKQYLHDVAARIAHTLNGSYEISGCDALNSYELSKFSHLERVPSFNGSVEANAFNGSRNEIFDALRYKAYRMFKTNTLNLEALTVYGNRISNGSEHIKYLAPNVFQWVEANYSGRHSVMTRSEAGINASKIRSDKVKNKILSALKYPLFFNMNEQSISQASKRLKVSRVTFVKHLELSKKLKQLPRELRRAVTPYVRLVLSPIQDMAQEVAEVVKWSVRPSKKAILTPVMTTAPPNTA